MAEDKSDAATLVKNRRAANPPSRRVAEPMGPTVSTGSRSVGLTSDSPAPPSVLTGSFVAGHTTSGDYVVAKDDAYTSWYPRGARQPTTVRVWSRGQLVHRDFYAQHGGDSAAATPAATVPTNEPGGGLPMPS